MSTISKIRLLTRRETSDYLLAEWGISRTRKTLAKLATIGGGPAYRKDARRCLYDPRDLDEWAQSTLSPKVSNTAELMSLKQVEGNGEGWSWKD